MDDLGTELPQRTVMVRILVGAAVVLTVPTLRTAVTAAGLTGRDAVGAWAMSLVMLAVLVVLPLTLARSIRQRHTFVSDEAVTVITAGGRHRRAAFADLTAVRVRVSGQGGTFLQNEKVFLIGPGDTETSRVVLVSRMHVATVRPLLDRLATEVERRPVLLSGDLERDYFERALVTAP